MSLKEPWLKMSKSELDSRSRIDLTDSPEVISKKIRLALTDSTASVSYDPLARPGVSNLLAIVSHLQKQESPEALGERISSLSLAELKDMVTTTISDHLCDFRIRYADLMEVGNVHYLDEVAARGAQKAQDQANVMLDKVRYATGLL